MPEATTHHGARAHGGTGRPVLKALALLFLAALAYVLSLVVTAPARVIGRLAPLPPAVDSLSGTIWRGAALLRSGHVLSWRFEPAASLRAGAPRFGLKLEGDDTLLTAVAAPRRDRIELSGLAGRAGWALSRAAAPGLALRCDPVARVDVARAVLRPGFAGAEGTLTTPAGTCTRAGRDVAVPPLVLRLTSEAPVSRAMLASADGAELAEAVLTANTGIIVTIRPEGAALVPGMPAGGPVAIEMPL